MSLLSGLRSQAPHGRLAMRGDLLPCCAFVRKVREVKWRSDLQPQPLWTRPAALRRQRGKRTLQKTRHHRSRAARHQRADTRLETRHLATAAARPLRKQDVDQALLGEARPE